MDYSTPGSSALHYFPELLKLMSIESVMPPNHLILCYSHLLLPLSFPASESFPVWRLFTSGDPSLELQLQHQSSNEYSGLISSRIDWFGLFEVQGILKSLPQHHSSKALILGIWGQRILWMGPACALWNVQ